LCNMFKGLFEFFLVFFVIHIIFLCECNIIFFVCTKPKHCFLEVRLPAVKQTVAGGNITHTCVK
jgi:hypothetical protein